MLSIRWRPSGGRGEYEYIAKGIRVLGKRIEVKVPGVEARIGTDVTFQVKDGKPRLRRDNPNDRSMLNVPPLVAAIAGLPSPRREDQEGDIVYPLSERSYVVDEVLFDVIEEDDDNIVVVPVLMKPRNATTHIDIESRVEFLLSQAGIPAVDDWRAALLDEINHAPTLTAAATNVHEAYPYVESNDDGFDATSEIADEADEIIEAYVGNEGKVRIRIHRHKERDRKLVRLAKKKFRLTHGKLFCECCGIDFEQTYGPLGADFMEAHHRVPLSTVAENAMTSIEDLAMLCANCHRMVHRTDACSLDEVTRLLRDRNQVVNVANLALLTLVAAGPA